MLQQYQGAFAGQNKNRMKTLRDRIAGIVGSAPLISTYARHICSRGATVFALHRVLPKETPCFESELVTSVETFSDFLDWVQENYEVRPLAELFQRRGEKINAARPPCALTFDDGWYDNYLFAFPELRKRNLPATIFLPTRFIGTDRKFWQESLWLSLCEIRNEEDFKEIIDRVALRMPWFPCAKDIAPAYGSIKRILLKRSAEEAEDFTNYLAEFAPPAQSSLSRSFVNWREVQEMQDSQISFGSHTLNHVLLPTSSPRSGQAEVLNSRLDLQEKLRQEPCGFAYPWGALGPFTRGQVSDAGYVFAFTIQPGLVTDTTDPLLLPRIPLSEAVLDGGRGRFSPAKTRGSFAKNIFFSTSSYGSTRPEPEKKLKIAFVIDGIDSWQGGTETHLQSLVKSLGKEYYEPRIFCLVRHPQLAEETFPCPVEFVWSPSEKKVSPLSKLRRLRRMLIGFAPDIVQTYFTEGTIYGILAARLAGTKRIVGNSRNMTYWNKFGERVLLRFVQRFADRWVCNSRATWNYQIEKGRVPSDSVVILPNGIDFSRFFPPSGSERAAARKHFGLGPEDLMIVSIANLRPIKDLRTLISAARIVLQSIPGARFVLVGEGPLRRDLENQAEALGLKSRIVFAGGQSDTRQYLSAADIAVLTSQSEGSSNSLLEYMAMGLPVVASDIPANRDLIKEFLFKPGDSAQLAENLLRLGRDVQLRNQISRCYQKSAIAFGMDTFALRAQTFYNELCRTEL